MRPWAYIRALVGVVYFTSLGGCSNSDPLEKETEQSFPLAPNGSLVVENGDGALRISGWNEPRVRIATLSKAYTASRLHQIEVVTKPGPNSLMVQTEVPPVRSFLADRSGTVEYSIDAPAASNLTLRLCNGEVSLKNLRGGKAQVELRNGRITILDCFASIEAREGNGVMECFFDRWERLSSSINLAVHQGRVGLRLPARAGFRIDAHTASGHINNEFGLKSSVRGSGANLAGATGSQPAISLGVHLDEGNITIDAVR